MMAPKMKVMGTAATNTRVAPLTRIYVNAWTSFDVCVSSNSRCRLEQRSFDQAERPRVQSKNPGKAFSSRQNHAQASIPKREPRPRAAKTWQWWASYAKVVEAVKRIQLPIAHLPTIHPRIVAFRTEEEKKKKRKEFQNQQQIGRDGAALPSTTWLGSARLFVFKLHGNLTLTIQRALGLPTVDTREVPSSLKEDPSGWPYVPSPPEQAITPFWLSGLPTTPTTRTILPEPSSYTIQTSPTSKQRSSHARKALWLEWRCGRFHSGFRRSSRQLKRCPTMRWRAASGWQAGAM